MSHLQQSLHSSSVAETLATYETWAATYDRDVASEDYTAPALAAEYVARDLGSAQRLASARILDAGCGTGLVGQQLARRGALRVDGVDLSPAMLAAARRTGAYAELKTADLSGPLELPTGSYDVLTCVGTLTQGHVGPGALDEMLRVVRKGGLLVVTVRESVWRENGYEEKVREILARGRARLMTDDFEVRRVAKDVDLVYVVLQV
ncbi:Methyltransferase type 11 [Cordyceps fumosorosea ARSEF 2679]|uniref:Methyltransferase type 11 n=1 Tax=Cordyceps fumosorosea (strain ARSEF 2679) TaxID=1081104 RepID=A0A168CG82_CORFA|nr:Methyltransferase type 11 [Cordyceps fumosorosea ARSEF 2679]OAA71336.1 Methyltransferase type 11 [Cordyceps fumosorosea ARSEF 2679]